MNKQEFLGMMESDSKLWETAETSAEGDKVVKTIDIPWGIGKTTVTLEGIGNVNGRRAAFSSFGEYIRGLVNDRISDDAITARAEQAAEKVSETSDRFIAIAGTSPVTTEEAFNKNPIPSFDEVGLQDQDPATRLTKLRRGCDLARAYIDDTTTEIKALEAYMEIINASGNKKPPLSDSQEAVEGES